MTMPKEQRQAWVARGLRDPVTAYRAHAVSAAQRGIQFKLTFDEWWTLWEPHYEQRGKHPGQKVMCRTGDAGAYEVGNVRIDTVQGNANERSRMHRNGNLAAGRVPLAEDRPVLHHGVGDWLRCRRDVFKPYVEDEEQL